MAPSIPLVNSPQIRSTGLSLVRTSHHEWCRNPLSMSSIATPTRAYRRRRILAPMFLDRSLVHCAVPGSRMTAIVSSKGDRSEQATRFDGGKAMARRTLIMAAGVVLVTGASIAARHDDKQKAARQLAVKEIVEKLDGKETNATAVEVTLNPARRASRTAILDRRSGTCWRVSTSGRSTTNRPNCSRRARRFTSRAVACTGCPATRAR